MELRQLKYFAEAAERLSFTEAARTLFVTQSTLSQQIKQLEEELGVLLFDRIAKKVLLTEAGEAFLPYAKKTILDAEIGKQKIMDLRNMESGTLRIGVTYSLSPLLTDAILSFSKRYPAVNLEIVYCSSYDLLELLRTHDVDLILSFLPAAGNPGFESLFLFESRLSVIVHRHHPFAALKSVSLDKLQETKFALLSREFTARTIFDKVSDEKGFKIRPAIELNEVNILLQLIKRGGWATVLSQATITGNPELKAIPIKETGYKMNAGLITLKNTYIKKSLTAFCKIVLEKSKELDYFR